MKSIIEKFYYNELVPCEMPVPNSEKYRKTKEFFAQTEEEFLKRFPESKHMLAEYKEVLLSLSAMESVNDFARGFRMGAKFMIDVFSTEKEEKTKQ